MRKHTFIMTLFGVSALILGACSPKQPETKKVVLTVWSPAEDQDETQGNWLKMMCDEFNEANPAWDIEFKYGAVSEGDIGKTVAQDAKNSADVYLFSNDQIGTLIDANGIVKLGGDTAKEVQANNSQLIVDSVTKDGDIYGVPFTTNTWFMYYDASSFNEDEIKSLNKMIDKEKVAFPMTTAWYNGSFFLASGGTMFGNGNDTSAGIDFGKEKGVAAVNAMVDLAAHPNFVNDSDGAGLAGLRSGDVKAYFSGSWDYAEVKKILGDHFGAAQLPMIQIGNEQKQLKSFAGSKAIGVNPNCENQEVAVALASYLGSAHAQQKHYELRSVIPCHKELLADETISKDLLIQAQNNTILNTSIIQPTLSEMAPYWEAAEVFGKAIISKDVTKDNAQQKLEDYVAQLNK